MVLSNHEWFTQVTSYENPEDFVSSLNYYALLVEILIIYEIYTIWSLKAEMCLGFQTCVTLGFGIFSPTLTHNRSI